jgi:hypothetical protein
MVAAEYENQYLARKSPTWTPYQRLLRQVGAYLDLESASQACVIEVNDGFLVRHQSHENPWQGVSLRLSVQQLLEADARRMGRRSAPDRSADGSKDGAYEDIMRAIGYHLEQVSARDIVLDEVDGSYAITYHFLRRVEMTRRKHRMMITPDDTEEVLRQARARWPAQRAWLSPSGEPLPLPVVVAGGQ